MSYVIQNFYDYNRKLTLTPRFKFLFFVININKFIFFIKFNNLLNLINSLNFLINSNFIIFSKFFFSSSYLKILNSINLTITNFYLNNLTKSYIYNIFLNLNFYLDSNKFLSSFKSNINWSNLYLYNFYFISIKTIKFQINNNFFKNIFFFYMFKNNFLWYSNCLNLKFYLNFILSNNNLKLNKFYNSYFLKIYNY